MTIFPVLMYLESRDPSWICSN